MRATRSRDPPCPLSRVCSSRSAAPALPRASSGPGTPLRPRLPRPLPIPALPKAASPPMPPGLWPDPRLCAVPPGLPAEESLLDASRIIMGSPEGRFHFAIDRGGTFTDVFAQCPGGHVRVLKLLSEDPANYVDAPTEGIRRILEQVARTGRRGGVGPGDQRPDTDRGVPRRGACRCPGTGRWTPVALPASAWAPQWPPTPCWSGAGSGWPCWSHVASGTCCTWAPRPERTSLIW